MNKFTLVLIFSVIAFINGAVDHFNTEPYHSFDWLDEDKHSFTVTYTSNTNTLPDFCYLFNQSVVCKAENCNANGKSLSCDVVGDSCKADGDNPGYKYYYAVYCAETTSSSHQNYTKNSTPEQIFYYITTAKHANGSLIGPKEDVGVTIAVCSGSFLKYSMILLSLLIL